MDGKICQNIKVPTTIPSSVQLIQLSTWGRLGD